MKKMILANVIYIQLRDEDGIKPINVYCLYQLHIPEPLIQIKNDKETQHTHAHTHTSPSERERESKKQDSL